MIRLVIVLIALGTLAGCTRPNASTPDRFVEPTQTSRVIVVTATSVPAPAASSATTAATHVLSGILTVMNDDLRMPSDDSKPTCLSGSGYEDITEGTQVLLKDGDGHTLGIAALGQVNVTAIDALPKGGARMHCAFGFAFNKIPSVPFYVFTIGTHDGPTYSYDQLVRVGWVAEMSLGS